MSIKIEIEAPELVEAIKALAQALDTKPVAMLETAIESEQTISEKETAKKKDTAPAVTLEEVRAKLAALSQSGKQTEVKALIQKFGAAKLTEIPEDRFAEVLKEAESL